MLIRNKKTKKKVGRVEGIVVLLLEDFYGFSGALIGALAVLTFVYIGFQMMLNQQGSDREWLLFLISALGILVFASIRAFIGRYEIDPEIQTSNDDDVA